MMSGDKGLRKKKSLASIAGSFVSMRTSNSGVQELRQENVPPVPSLDANPEWTWTREATPSKPPKRRRENEIYHPHAKWEIYKSTIVQLYTKDNLRLETVQEKMYEDFGFKASEAQYKHKFKQWGVSKNTDFTSNRLLYILQEVVRRSANPEKKAAGFRLGGDRLKSKNVQSAVDRHFVVIGTIDGQTHIKLKGTDTTIIADENGELNINAQRHSSGGLSGYTSSSKGVTLKNAPKTPFLTRLGINVGRSDNKEKSVPAAMTTTDGLTVCPTPPPNLGNCLVKVTDSGMPQPIGGGGSEMHSDFQSTSDGLPSLTMSSGSGHISTQRAVFDPWNMSMMFGMLDHALDIIRGHGTGVNFQVRGLVLPDEVKLVLCFLHLTSGFAHTEDFTGFRVDKGVRVYTDGSDRQRRVQSRKVAPNLYCIQCSGCGFLHEITDSTSKNGDESAIGHREMHQTWPDTLINNIRECMQQHRQMIEDYYYSTFGNQPPVYAPPPLHNFHRTREGNELNTYFGEWQESDKRHSQLIYAAALANVQMPYEDVSLTDIKRARRAFAIIPGPGNSKGSIWENAIPNAGVNYKNWMSAQGPVAGPQVVNESTADGFQGLGLDDDAMGEILAQYDNLQLPVENYDLNDTAGFQCDPDTLMKDYIRPEMLE